MSDREDTTREIILLLEKFRRITLDDLSGNLQDRYDEKYIIPDGLYREMLEQLRPYYHVLEVDGIRNYQYVSTYLDLPGFPMYHAHHNGKKTRYKIRFRRYVHSGQVYLEVKHKINKGKTLKKRILREREENPLSEVSRDFFREYTRFDPEEMVPSVSISFSRITLALPDGRERITWDHGLLFSDHGGRRALPGFGVMEIKHAGRKHSSPMKEMLMRYRQRPGSGSKYCTGILLMYPDVKYNMYKPLLKTLKEKYHDAGAVHSGRG